MRKLIVSEFITVDGVMEGPGSMDNFKYAGWTMPYSNEEIMKFKHDELFAADALLLGRTTYEGFAEAWPKMKGTGDFGERMNGMTKYVVSTAVEDLQWNNSSLVTPEEISKLKGQSGKDILVFGSGELVNHLVRAGHVDEFRLLVYPVVLGTGKRLFKDDTNVKLKLLETKKFSSGVVLLRYALDPSLAKSDKKSKK